MKWTLKRLRVENDYQDYLQHLFRAICNKCDIVNVHVLTGYFRWNVGTPERSRKKERLRSERMGITGTPVYEACNNTIQTLQSRYNELDKQFDTHPQPLFYFYLFHWPPTADIKYPYVHHELLY